MGILFFLKKDMPRAVPTKISYLGAGLGFFTLYPGYAGYVVGTLGRYVRNLDCDKVIYFKIITHER